jgi:hypothetical protein
MKNITYHNGLAEPIDREVIDKTLDIALKDYNISGVVVCIETHPEFFGVKTKTMVLTINLEENV